MRISDFLYPESITRCQHIKINGVQCGSPSLTNRKFCFFHEKSRQRRLAMRRSQSSCWRFVDQLPLLEDANSIQVALMQVMRLLMTHRIEYKEASLLLYALQTASSNLRNTTFEPSPEQVVINRRGVPETSVGDQAWYKEEFEGEKDKECDDSEPVAHIEACADVARTPSAQPCPERSRRECSRHIRRGTFLQSFSSAGTSDLGGLAAR